jgi:hypothetical protein
MSWAWPGERQACSDLSGQTKGTRAGREQTDGPTKKRWTDRKTTGRQADRQGHKGEVTASSMGTDIQLLKGKRFKSSLRLKPIKVQQGCSVQANPSRWVGRVPVQSRQVVTHPAHYSLLCCFKQRFNEVIGSVIPAIPLEESASDR